MGVLVLAASHAHADKEQAAGTAMYASTRQTPIYAIQLVFVDRRLTGYCR